MPGKIIYCKDCASEKKKIEESGLMRFVSYQKLPGQEIIPDDLKQCKIKWIPK